METSESTDLFRVYNKKKLHKSATSMEAIADCQFKLIIAGDAETGKNAILLRFCKDEFSSVYKPTIGDDYYQRFVKLAQAHAKSLAGYLQDKSDFLLL